MRVAVLFAMPLSVYHSIPECDVYDEQRNALTYRGGLPVVAHPPCRTWSRMHRFATRAHPGEESLALWAIWKVRKCGGVLEHPETSRLWSEGGLPPPGEVDQFGGFTLSVLQWWWGHRAEKATRLYVVGCRMADLPPIPYRIGEPSHVVATSRRNTARKLEVSKRERSATPPAFAAWLVDVASRCAA